MPVTIEHFLLAGSILLFVSLIAGKTVYKFGAPTLLLFLIFDMFAETDGHNLQFDCSNTVQLIGRCTLITILFSGGMKIQTCHGRRNCDLSSIKDSQKQQNINIKFQKVI